MFAGLAGILIGMVAYVVAPNRNLLGMALVPAWAGVTALVVWEGLTWLSSIDGFAWLAYDQGWIWPIALGITAVVAFTLSITLARHRHESDEDLFERLSNVGRASV